MEAVSGSFGSIPEPCVCPVEFKRNLSLLDEFYKKKGGFSKWKCWEGWTGSLPRTKTLVDWRGVPPFGGNPLLLVEWGSKTY